MRTLGLLLLIAVGGNASTLTTCGAQGGPALTDASACDSIGIYNNYAKASATESLTFSGNELDYSFNIFATVEDGCDAPMGQICGDFNTQDSAQATLSTILNVKLTDAGYYSFDAIGIVAGHDGGGGDGEVTNVDGFTTCPCLPIAHGVYWQDEGSLAIPISAYADAFWGQDEGAGFASGTIKFYFFNADGTPDQVLSATTAPEPASLPLFVGGTILLIALRLAARGRVCRSKA